MACWLAKDRVKVFERCFCGESVYSKADNVLSLELCQLVRAAGILFINRFENRLKSWETICFKYAINITSSSYNKGEGNEI